MNAPDRTMRVVFTSSAHAREVFERLFPGVDATLELDSPATLEFSDGSHTMLGTTCGVVRQHGSTVVFEWDQPLRAEVVADGRTMRLTNVRLESAALVGEMEGGAAAGAEAE